MFKRLLLEEHTALCLMIAFATAATIFLAFLWRALRMSRSQVDRFANLPFAELPPGRDPNATSESEPRTRR